MSREMMMIAIDQIGFEYFKNCIANGATDEEAKAEMMTENAQIIIAKRIKEIFAA